MAAEDRVTEVQHHLEIESANRADAVEWALYERRLRVAATERVALLERKVQRLQAQWDRLQRGLAPPFVAGAAWPVGEE